MQKGTQSELALSFSHGNRDYLRRKAESKNTLLSNIKAELGSGIAVIEKLSIANVSRLPEPEVADKVTTLNTTSS